MDLKALQKEYQQESKKAEELCKVLEHEIDVLVKNDRITVGARAILLYKRDVDRLRSAIEENFEDVKVEYKKEELGYQALHLDVKMPFTWATVPSYTKFVGLRAEIQVRTVAQHAWAAVSRDLQYGREDDVPKPVLRKLRRLVAVLEIVDDEFAGVLAARDTYADRVDPKTTDEPLNVDLVAKILNARLPDANKTETEDYALVLEELGYFGIRTSSALNDLFDGGLAQALESDARAAEEHTGPDPMFTKAEEARIARGVYLSHAGLIADMLMEKHGSRKFVEFWKERSARSGSHDESAEGSCELGDDVAR